MRPDWCPGSRRQYLGNVDPAGVELSLEKQVVAEVKEARSRGFTSRCDQTLNAIGVDQCLTDAISTDGSGHARTSRALKDDKTDPSRRTMPDKRQESYSRFAAWQVGGYDTSSTQWTEWPGIRLCG